MSMQIGKNIKAQDVLDCNIELYAHNNEEDYALLMKRIGKGTRYKAKTLSIDYIKEHQDKYDINFYDPAEPECAEVKLIGCKSMVLDFEDCEWETFIYFDKPLNEVKLHDKLQAYGRNDSSHTYISTMQFWQFELLWNSDEHPERFV